MEFIMNRNVQLTPKISNSSIKTFSSFFSYARLKSQFRNNIEKEDKDEKME